MKHILNNLSFGNKQQVGVMSVIPLIGEDASDNFTSLKDVKFKGTIGYGKMSFQNNSEKLAIIPTGYSIITNQQAQDHGTPFACLLPAHQTGVVDLSCCIEQTQPGMINGESVDSFYFLPLEVRRKHFEEYIINSRMENTEFSRLWSIISTFQSTLVNDNKAHLVYFFNKFMDKLTQFNAEFEIVPNQRGAIIMLNDKVVGIEITPTHEYWKSIWHSLIRDCYGSEVVRLTTANLIKEFKTSQNEDLNLEDCKSIEDIENALQSFQNSQADKSYSKVVELLDNNYKSIEKYTNVIRRNSSNNLQYSIVSSADKKSFGEVYEQSGNVMYCSLLFA